MSNQNTLRNRLSEHVGTVAEAESIVFDPDAPSIPRIEAKPIAFNGYAEPEERQKQDMILKLSLFKGGTADAPTYAWSPYTSVTRKHNDALKLKISTRNLNGGFTSLTQEEFEALYHLWVPAVLTASPSAKGAEAHSVRFGSTCAVLAVLTGEGPFDSLSVDIGGSGNPEAWPIEEALARLGLTWTYVAGTLASEPQRPRREEFENVHIPTIGAVQFNREFLTSGNTLQALIMSNLGVLPTGDDPDTTVAALANYVTCAWDRGDIVEAVQICLFQYAKTLAPEEDPMSPGEVLAATVGGKIVATFASVINAIGTDAIQRIADSIRGADAGGNARLSGAVFGSEVRTLIEAAPLPAAVPSPQAERLAGMRRQQEVAGARGMPRPTGGGGIFGSTPPDVEPGANAGAFAVLVPSSDPAASQLDVINQLGGAELVANLRLWAACRPDMGTAFDLLGAQSIAYAEDDFKVLTQLAYSTPAEQAKGIARPTTWGDASGLLQRIVTEALAKDKAPTATAPAGEAYAGGSTRFRPPHGSVVELPRATEAQMPQAVAARMLIPLGRPSTIIKLHAKCQAEDALREEARPDPYTRVRSLVEDEDAGTSLRALLISNLKYYGEMPQKGEIALAGVAAKAAVHERVRADIEQCLGTALAEQQAADVAKLATQLTTFRSEITLISRLLGATASIDDEMGAEGRLGTTKGPTAGADLERAMLKLAKIWRDWAGRALGVDTHVENFGLDTLVQACRELSDAGRCEVLQHALDVIAREASAMRRDAAAPLLDITGATVKARVNKLMRTRTIEEARAAGLAAVKEAQGTSDNAPKRKGANPAAGIAAHKPQHKHSKAQHGIAQHTSTARAHTVRRRLT